MHSCFQHATDAPRFSHTTRMFSRQNEMRPQRLNLNMLIVELTSTFEQVLGRDIQLDIECEQDVPPILGVANMVKLALAGAGAVTLTVGADWVLLLLPVRRRSRSNQKGAPCAAAIAVTMIPTIFQMRLVSQLGLPGNRVQKLWPLS